MEKFESFFSGKDPKKVESLNDLVEKTYNSQNVRLTSQEISLILRTLKNTIDRLKAKNMTRMANDKELILKSILDKLN
jgi:hypothetical protein